MIKHSKYFLRSVQAQWKRIKASNYCWIVHLDSVPSPYFMGFRSWENQKILVQFNFGLNKLPRGSVWQLENLRRVSGPDYFASTPVPYDVSGDFCPCVGALSLLVWAVVHSWNSSSRSLLPLPLGTGECTGGVKGTLLVFGCGNLWTSA